MPLLASADGRHSKPCPYDHAGLFSSSALSSKKDESHMAEKNNKPSPSQDNIPTDVLAESDNYLVWVSDEPDGERVYHIELGAVTLHFFQEEWDELSGLVLAATDKLT